LRAYPDFDSVAARLSALYTAQRSKARGVTE